MGDTWAILSAMKTALSEISNVKTCGIGINTDISPDDYPIIRIVPEKISEGSPIGRVLISVWVYYGVNLTEADSGLEAVYETLSSMQNAIVSALHSHSGTFIAEWKETVTDEDRLDQFKLFASRFEVVG